MALVWPGQNIPESAPLCVFLALFMAFYHLLAICDFFVCIPVQEIPLRTPVVQVMSY